MRKVQTYNEPNQNRIDSSLLKAFKENPYTQSLQAGLKLFYLLMYVIINNYTL